MTSALTASGQMSGMVARVVPSARAGHIPVYAVQSVARQRNAVLTSANHCLTFDDFNPAPA